MHRTITFRQAINEALDQEMARDPSIVLLGEDIAGGRGAGGELDAWGGLLGVTKGLYAKYGDRVMDTPISEAAFVGAAIGAAGAGLRPVVELMFNDFAGVCFDQILNQAAKLRYMTGGKATLPVVIRTTCGSGFRGAAQHSQSLYAIFTHVPGLKCVVPSTPYDAKGLLVESIRGEDPVIFFEHRNLYDVEGPVPEEPYTIPLGRAETVRPGRHVTVVALAEMVHAARRAADVLASQGVDCEVIDLRTTSPLDDETIVRSVERTGRLVVVDEATPRCGIAADVAAIVGHKAFASLRAPVQMVTAPHTPAPFSDVLEDLYKPNDARIVAAVRAVLD